MPYYTVYTPRKYTHSLPPEAGNAKRYWKYYTGPLDENQVRYASARGTFPMPDTADACLWRGGKAIIPLLAGTYIIRLAGKGSTFWKYNGNTLVLENGFDATGIRWKSSRPLGKICGSYDKCVHSTKRKAPSWRVLPSCPCLHKYQLGNRWHLPQDSLCVSCPDYQYDRSLMNKGK